jgi:ring-1,2-phenylacetyl-CoA epoxidase subunit PaaC
MAAAGQLPGPGDLDDDQREAVELLLRRLADDEFVLAERYTEWQVKAPTLESDLALSNIAQDELGHARLWYDLLMDFGHEESDLIFERGHEGWRHATLVELPFETGDWADAVVRSYLYDVAEELRLAALEDSSYERIAARVEKIQGEEEYHREHAENWLERFAEGDDEEPRSSEHASGQRPRAEGRERVQRAVDRLYPHALTLFVPGDEDVDARIDDLGLRTRSLDEMRGEWEETVAEFLTSLGVEVPTDADLPPAVGRDASYTDDWPALYDDFTRTYRELGRDRADRIMKDPDDVE